MTDIYKEIIMEHYKNPQNKGLMEKADVSASDTNPNCGDAITMQLKMENNIVKEIKFHGHGCAISQAAASMLTEKIKGKNTEEIAKISKEEVLKSLGIEISPMRLKCALLCLKVAKSAALAQLGKETKDAENEFRKE